MKETKNSKCINTSYNSFITAKSSTAGITLIALVITIVILLILSGIAISTLTDSGLFKNAKEAKEKSENAEKEQSRVIGEYEKK